MLVTNNRQLASDIWYSLVVLVMSSLECTWYTRFQKIVDLRKKENFDSTNKAIKASAVRGCWVLPGKRAIQLH